MVSQILFKILLILTWSQLSDVDTLHHGNRFLKPEMDVL